VHTCLAAWCLCWAVPDLPPLSDLARFPPLWLVRHELQFSAAHQSWLQLRIDTEPANRADLKIWLTESRRCAEPWVILEGIHVGYDRWAGFEKYHTDLGKRQRLLELCRLIGWQSYYEGVLPPVVPLWYFRRGYDVPVIVPTPRHTCKAAAR